MKARQKLFTDEQWELVGALLPPPDSDSTGAVGRQPLTELVSKVSCGFCRPVRRGASCRRSFRRLPRAGDGSSNGRKKAYGCRPGGHCWGRWTKRVC